MNQRIDGHIMAEHPRARPSGHEEPAWEAREGAGVGAGVGSRCLSGAWETREGAGMRAGGGNRCGRRTREQEGSE